MKNYVPGGLGRRLCATALIALIVPLFAACSVGGKVRSAFGGQLPLRVTVVPGANDDSAIAVDFVVVYTDKLLDEIIKLPAAEWFSKKKTFLADHPKELVVISREWVPGQTVDQQTISYTPGVRKVIVFANYQSGGEHRAVVPPQQPSMITLGETDLKVEALQ